MNKLLWNNALFVLLVASVLFNSGCVGFSPVAPTSWAISPTAISAGSGAFTLKVRGRNFNPGDTVVWNGVKLATNLVGGTTAQAVVPATAVANPGTAQVAMWDSQTGRISNAATFTITQASYATPAVSVSVTPTSTSLLTGGTQQFTATVANTTNTAVTWSVASGGGTISSGGLYTAPSTAGTATVVATSVADASASALAYVTVNAPATTSLTASPTSISFGSVMVGSSATKAVTLSNTGNSSVTVFSASMAGPGFSLSGLTFPFTLAAGASQAATLTFAPSSSGTATSSVSFVSNATNSPATVALSGSGTAPLPHSVTLSWQPSTATVSGYNVYRAGTSGGPYTRLNSVLDPTATFSDTSVQSGLTYCYVVTSVDSTGLESGYSNQVAVVVPTP